MKSLMLLDNTSGSEKKDIKVKFLVYMMEKCARAAYVVPSSQTLSNNTVSNTRIAVIHKHYCK
jgi:hypothetical protein